MTKRTITPADPAAELGKHVLAPDGNVAHEPAGRPLPQRTPFQTDADQSELYSESIRQRSEQVSGPALNQVGALSTRGLLENVLGTNADGHVHTAPVPQQHEQPMTEGLALDAIPGRLDAAQTIPDGSAADFADHGQQGDVKPARPARTRSRKPRKQP
jgi:hypothetical protein